MIGVINNINDNKYHLQLSYRMTEFICNLKDAERLCVYVVFEPSDHVWAQQRIRSPVSSYLR